MANGITVSQEGIDISQALDSQKVLDSRWRYFDIVYEKKVQLGTTVSGTTQLIFQHDLGYVPAFDCYDITSDVYLSADEFGGIRANRTHVYSAGFSSDNYSNHQVMIRIYKVPITEEYEAPVQKTLPSKTSSESNYGVKAGYGNSLDEYELSKYSLNTASKTLAIQKTGLVSSNSGTNYEAKVTHNLGNPPIFLATYADPKGEWVGGLAMDFIPVIGSADEKSVTFSGAQSALAGTLAYIIFKELGELVG
jgi:hypothetical protein